MSENNPKDIVPELNERIDALGNAILSHKHPHENDARSVFPRDSIAWYLQDLAIWQNEARGNDWSACDIVDKLTTDMETLGVDINAGIENYES